MTITLIALNDTVLKTSTDQAATLPATQKHPLRAGDRLPIAAVAEYNPAYWNVTLGRINGQQMSFNGKNTYLAYKPDVKLDGYLSDPSEPRQINASGLQLLKAFEGCKLDAYCDCVGVWTIGYGTTTEVSPRMSITANQAEELLKVDLRRFEQAVQQIVKVLLNDDQFSALVSFTYNVGEGALASSSALRVLNNGNYADAGDRLLLWNRGDCGELPGLTRRRKAERALFLSQNFTQFL